MFDAENIPYQEDQELRDIYITAFLDEKNKKSTDTHYRCPNGKPSFNWRLLFDVKAPRDDYELVIQAWDRDLFSSNDVICQWTMDCSKLFELVRLSQHSNDFKQKILELGTTDEELDALS